MSTTIMDHPIFCNLSKLLHTISNKPKSAHEVLRQTGGELNRITDLLNDMKKNDINTSDELQLLYNEYQKHNQNYLDLVKHYGMEMPDVKPGENISKIPPPVRDPMRKQKAFQKSSRENSKNLFSNVQQLGVSMQAASNKMKLMSFEALVSPPPLTSNDSSESSSSGSDASA
ncbi:hypothetical protein BDQ12DRAFT_723727 [Crucibulum laeve]|uniref:Uncharacterized protein n=1 Tax=Crucibulum laeve TaxID=68775 RepID=A0A5C3LYE7_9AGAR|nr:hypothetical protein BDQ12DRAFT_723727 [Crucibulum laeve]